MNKLVILIDGLTIAGAEKQALVLAGELARTDHVSLMYLKTANLDELARARYILGGNNNIAINQLRTSNLWGIVTSNGCTLVTFAAKANLIGRIAKLLNSNIRLVTSIRNERFANKLVSFAYRYSAFINEITVYNAESSLYSCVSNRFSKKCKSKYIENYIELESSSSKDFVKIEHLAYFGRLVPQKRVGMLLKAFKKMLSSGYKLSLSIYGHGSELIELKSIATALALDDYVSFKGSYKSISDYLDDVDLVVLPSEWEGMPNVVLECGIIGMPVIGSDAGGMRDIENNLQYNQFVKLDSDEKLFDHLVCWLHKNPKEINSMCKDLKNYLLENHGKEVISNKWRKALHDS